MRTLDAIQLDLDAALVREAEARRAVAGLRVELAEATEARRLAIVKAFDDGASLPQIYAAFPALEEETVRGILWRAGRTERHRRALKLPIEKRPHYNRLIGQGLSSRMAAQIAESLS